MDLKLGKFPIRYISAVLGAHSLAWACGAAGSAVDFSPGDRGFEAHWVLSFCQNQKNPQSRGNSGKIEKSRNMKKIARNPRT